MKRFAEINLRFRWDTLLWGALALVGAGFLAWVVNQLVSLADGFNGGLV